MATNSHPLRPSTKSNSPTPTSPLRIAKRDELSLSALGAKPSSSKGEPLARRQSNSYAHLRKNQLVTQSPFLAKKASVGPGSEVPAPLGPSTSRIRPRSVGIVPRKVSGEKRARPVSMQAEELRESGQNRYKRRQSGGLQHLESLESVSNSPFKREQADIPPPLPPKNSAPAPTSAPFSIARVPVPVEMQRSSPARGSPARGSPARGSPARGSPTRSVLVSRRLHGPRGTLTRARRKTVTFDERCDVVEFDRESHEMAFGDDEDGAWTDEDANGGEFDEHDRRNNSSTSHSDYQDQHDHHYSNAHDDSIVGLVDSMLQDAGTSHRPTTPPDQEMEVDSEGGAPYDHTHVEREATAHEHRPRDSDVSLDASVHTTTPPHLSSPSTDVGFEGSSDPATHVEHEVREVDRPVDVQTFTENSSSHKPSPSRFSMFTNMLPTFALDLSRSSSPRGSPRTSIQNPHTPNGDYLDPFPPVAPTSRGNSEPDVRDVSMDSEGSQNPGDSSIMSGYENPALSVSVLEAELGIFPGRTADNYSEGDQSFTIQHDGEKAEVEDEDQAMQTEEEPPRSSTPLHPPPGHGAEGSASNSPRQSVLARLSAPFARTGSPSGSPRSSSPLPPPPIRGASPYRGRESPVPHAPSPLAHAMSDSAVSSLSSVESGRPSSLASSATLGSLNGPPSADKDGNNQVIQMRLEKKDSADSPVHELPPEELGFAASYRKPDNVKSPYTPRKYASLEPMDVMSTGSTGADVHNATIEVAERAVPVPSPAGVRTRAVTLDSASAPSTPLFPTSLNERSGLDQLIADVAEANASGVSESFGRMRVEVVTEGVRPGTFSTPPRANTVREQRKNDETEDEMSDEEDYGELQPPTRPFVKAYTPPPSPPPASPSVPGPSARESRENAIINKRREARRRDDDQHMGLDTPPRDTRPPNSAVSRQPHSRSKSTNDAGKDMERLLDFAPIVQQSAPLADDIERELRKREAPSSKKYHVRERVEIVYASTDSDAVHHSSNAGDINAGKAWKSLRRPSDMNEYAKEIKAYREQSGKDHGKLFVRVAGIRGLNVPIPREPTAITCTLNNGIHFVTTDPLALARDCPIDQEFELIEHSKLEFTLTLKVRRDPHIVEQMKACMPPPPPPAAPAPVVRQPPPAPASKSRGVVNIFFGTPKKSQRAIMPPPPPPVQRSVPQPQFRMPENLARYMKPDDTLARAFIAFKDVVDHCDTRQFQIALPLIGQKSDLGGKVTPMQIGELVLDLFRLPALPGISPDELPQSLDECNRGLRNVSWHKQTYLEGILTQNGGDCKSWRRRHFRIIGSSLIAFNDVTKRPITSIDLRKAISVEDEQDLRKLLMSPQSGATSRFTDDVDILGVERSFRICFNNNQEISFFADSDEEKSRWLEVLRTMVGHIPPNPLWAELVWQRQQELRQTSSRTSTSSSAA